MKRLLLLLLLFFLYNTAHGEQLILQPDPIVGKDCLVEDSYPDANRDYSALVTGVQTDHNGGNNYSFIQFDLEGLPTDPSSVKLRLRNILYQRSDQGGDLSLIQ